MLILCLTCSRNKEEFEHFKQWRTDKTKARRCDHCNNDPAVTKRFEDNKAEQKVRRVSNKNVPVQAGLSKLEVSEEKCRVRNRIADIKQQKIDDDFVGDL